MKFWEFFFNHFSTKTFFLFCFGDNNCGVGDENVFRLELLNQMRPINKFVTTTMIVNMQIHSLSRTHKRRRRRKRQRERMWERGEREWDEILALSLSRGVARHNRKKRFFLFVFRREEIRGKPTNMSWGICVVLTVCHHHRPIFPSLPHLSLQRDRGEGEGGINSRKNQQIHKESKKNRSYGADSNLPTVSSCPTIDPKCPDSKKSCHQSLTLILDRVVWICSKYLAV